MQIRLHGPPRLEKARGRTCNYILTTLSIFFLQVGSHTDPVVWAPQAWESRKSISPHFYFRIYPHIILMLQWDTRYESLLTWFLTLVWYLLQANFFSTEPNADPVAGASQARESRKSLFSTLLMFLFSLSCRVPYRSGCTGLLGLRKPEVDLKPFK